MSGTVAKDLIVSFHYVLRNKEGEILDASEPDEPLPYLHGAGTIVEGLEEAMEGKSVGDKFDVVVPPEKGYGVALNDQAVVPRSDFGDLELEAGANLIAEDGDGEPFPIWIVEVREEEVVISPDHPLAGVELHFEAQVVAVRAATESELEHGHAHGVDGDEEELEFDDEDDED